MTEDAMIHKHVLERTDGVINIQIVWMNQMKKTVVRQSIVITVNALNADIT